MIVGVVVQDGGVEPATGDGAEGQLPRAVAAVRVFHCFLQVKLIHASAHGLHGGSEARSGNSASFTDTGNFCRALRGPHLHEEIAAISDLRSGDTLSLRAQDGQVCRYR